MEDTHFDAIIVGAGLGGLAAAATLAKNGWRVRLCERHSKPGGYASTFYRNPYEFEVSLHELSGIGSPGNRGSLWMILKELGVSERVKFHPIPTFYRTLADGVDVRVPAERQAALTAILDAFPHEHKGIAHVFEHLFHIKQEIEKMSREEKGVPSTLRSITRYPALSHAATVPLSTILYRYVKDPRARLVLGQVWGYFGLPPSQLSLVYFTGGFTSYLTHGATYPAGKSQTLSNTFVEIIEEAGGEVSLRDGVSRITCRDGRVTGALTEHGERLASNVIVANVNPLTTALELIGREHLPSPFLGRLITGRPSLSAFCVHLGLSRPIHELGIEDHEIFINESSDLEEQFYQACSMAPPTSFLMTSYNTIAPDFSPKGTSVIVLTSLCAGNLWHALEAQHYHEMKQQFTEAMIDKAAQHFPQIRLSLDQIASSTPITCMRYTGNIDGAIYGFANTPEENPAFRLPQKGPLEGLWFSGAWTQPGGGYSPCIESGNSAAKMIIAAHQPRKTHSLLQGAC